MLEHGLAPSTAGGYEIANSLRFEADDTASLNRTFSAGDTKKWTWAGWIKRTEEIYGDRIFACAPGSADSHIKFLNGQLNFQYYNGTSTVVDLRTTALLRDPSAWYHIVVIYDSAQATNTNRVKMYVNGVQLTDFSTATWPSQNLDTNLNSANAHYLSRAGQGDTSHMCGYMSEVYFVDGQALGPENFGETGDYGEWKPIEYTGTYGTNGFYLDFEGTDDVIKDATGNNSFVVNSGIVHSTAQAKFGNSSIDLQGGGNANTDSGYGIEWAGTSSVCPNGSNNITFECWYYHDGTTGVLWHGHQFDWYMPYFTVYNTGKIRFSNQANGGSDYYYVESSSTMNLNQWNHIAVTFASKVVNLFMNGSNVGSRTWTTGTWTIPSGKQILGVGATSYVDEIRISNSVRYSGSYTVPSTTFTEDGNTTLLIHSDFSGTGYLDDKSGNANNWTQNNITYDDQMLDSPTNNFATLNPLDSGTVTVSEGNTKGSITSSNKHSIKGTLGVSSGKWYFEVLGTAHAGGDTPLFIGMGQQNAELDNWVASGNYAVYEGDSGNTKIDGSGAGYGATYTTNDIVGVAVDADNDDITFYKNGVSQGLVSNCLVSGATYLPYIGDGSSVRSADFVANFGQDSSFAGNKTAQGNADGNGYGDFYYTPPTGFLALCTANLADPTVIPSEHFNTLTYTGDGATRSITGVGFQPDWLWIKGRNYTFNHMLFDNVRGAGLRLMSDSTAAEASYGQTSFDSDGWSMSGTMNAINESGKTYVAWNWKANGTGVSNTDGSITSTVSANTSSGFSIVSWTGNSSVATVGHGLTQAPELLIIKNRNDGTSNWVTLQTIGTDSTGYVNLTNAFGTGNLPYFFGNTSTYTAPTSTVFTVGNNSQVNDTGDNIIAYAFHSVDGYSKVGSYTGNGSTDGTFVYTGFAVKYVVVKRTDVAASWEVRDGERDPFNDGTTHRLFPNTSDAELDEAQAIDFTSNGFKIRTTHSNWNTSGGSYIYIAFAENPFKHTNAR